MERETWIKRRNRLFKGTYDGVDSQVVEVLKLLHNAWDERPIPDGKSEVGYSAENDEFGAVYAIYGGRDWKEVNPPDVSDGYACMTLMNTDVAKSYYTGTYLLRILEDYLDKNRYWIGELMSSVEVVLYNIIERGNLEKVFTQKQLLCLQQFFALPLDVFGDSYDSVREELDRVVASRG